MKGSSDDFSDANIQLVLAVVRKLQEKLETRACIVRNNSAMSSSFFFTSSWRDSDFHFEEILRYVTIFLGIS